MPIPFHLPINPVSTIIPDPFPNKFSFAMNFIILPFPSVRIAGRSEQLPFSVSASSLGIHLSFINYSIRKGFLEKFLGRREEPRLRDPRGIHRRIKSIRSIVRTALKNQYAILTANRPSLPLEIVFIPDAFFVFIGAFEQRERLSLVLLIS